jgi:hypothetical protein
VSKEIDTKDTYSMSSIDNTKIPGELKDHLRLCTYLSPGDLLVLWTSFKTACRLLDPKASPSFIRATTNLCGFWKTILDTATEAAESGEYPLECTIKFCRGDFFLVVLVMDRLLNTSDRDWFTESAKEPIAELRDFFKDRLYDPSLEQGIGAPYRRREAIANDLSVGKETLQKPRFVVPPNPQRIILFGVVLALLIPPERQPFSIGSVAHLMADLFHWDPLRTLEEINRCSKLCAQNPGYNPDSYKDETGLVHVKLPKELDYGPEIHDLKPIPTLRGIVAFAVSMALLVPEKNRRRDLALQSIARVMHDLFGWSQELASREISICVETWNEDGAEPNFWTDVTGRVNVGVPQKRRKTETTDGSNIGDRTRI